MTERENMLGLRSQLDEWAEQLGFSGLAVADTGLAVDEVRLQSWLSNGYHGTMGFMDRHGTLRSRPEELVPGTLRVISVTMAYLPASAAPAWQVINDSSRGYISRYAVGRDYHKLMRKRLQRLSAQLDAVTRHHYRVFVDSAPVLEKPLAAKAGLGWVGKHTNLINRQHGSWFFLGEIYTDLPLTADSPAPNHCGSCSACIDICPTAAIVAPYLLDARRCISYLTIEHVGAIPEPLRPLLGNRIYGCDDCQLVCPWNSFATATTEPAYQPRLGLDNPALVELFGWSEEVFLQRLEGSPIRRIGHQRWLRNIALALGNGIASDGAIAALTGRLDDDSEVVREHVAWALQRLTRQER